MNPRLTVGMAIVLVLVAVGVFWSEQQSETTPTPTPARSKVLDFQAQNATGLGVLWAGQQVNLRKDSGGQWSLTQPEEAPATSYQIDSTLASLGGLQSSRDLVVKPPDLGSYGLDNPQGVITVTLSVGESQRLIVGAKTPDQRAYYARRPWGDSSILVYVVPAAVVESAKSLVDSPPKMAPTPTPAPETPAATPAPAATP